MNDTTSARLETIFRVSLIALLLLEVVTQFAAQPWLHDPTAIGTDASTYYAAGLRLNAGHPLYGPLQPGDRAVPLVPPYFTVPLLSPPTIAVIWRVLAVLPGSIAMLAWWVLAGVLMLGVTVYLIWLGSRAQTRIILLMLSAYPLVAVATGWSTSWFSVFPGIPDSAVSGNVNAYLVALLAVVWWGLATNRPRVAGGAAALAAAIKVFPAILLPWFFLTGNARAGRSFLVAGFIILILTLVGVGFDNTIAYFRVMGETGIAGPTAISVPGIVAALGAPPAIAAAIVPIALAASLLAAFLLRRSPAASFSALMIGMVASSPVVHQGTLALYLTALIPFTPGPRAPDRGFLSHVPRDEAPATGMAD